MSVLVTSRESFAQTWCGILGHGGVVRCGKVADVPGLLGAGTQRLVVIDVGDPSVAFDNQQALDGLVRRARVLLAGRAFSIESELASLATGVAACCSPALSAAELATVVEVALRGGIWVSKEALPNLLGRLQGVAAARFGQDQERPKGAGNFEDAWSQLTPREREIASRVARGETNKAIARYLDISDATIKAHLTSVFQKLQVSGRLQLALLLSGREIPGNVETP